MKQKSTFKDWDFDTVWRIDEGNDYPRLRALTEGTIIITPNKTDVGVQAHDLKKEYDGKEVNTEEHLRTIATTNGYSDIVSVSGLKDGDTLSSLGGLTYGGTWQGAKNAGKYSIVPSGLNGGQKYEIKYDEGSLTIDKAPLEIYALNNFSDLAPVTTAQGIGFVAKGLVGDDKISSVNIDNTIYSGAKVGDKRTIKIKSINFSKGLESNYNINLNPDNQGSILELPENKSFLNIPILNTFVEGGDNFANTKDVERISFYRKKLDEKEVEKKLADLIYHDDFGEANLPDNIQIYKEEHKYDFGKKHDLQMSAYKEKDSDNYYIVYRGTTGTLFISKDWRTNLASTIAEPSQYTESLNRTNAIIADIKKENPNAKITFVGHSLGGSLAQYNALVIANNENSSNLKFNITTFNSAPIRTAGWIDIEKHTGKSKSELRKAYNQDTATHFIFDKDIVSWGLDNPFASGNISDPILVNLFTEGAVSDHYMEHINLTHQALKHIDDSYHVWNSPRIVKIKKPQFDHLKTQNVESLGYDIVNPAISSLITALDTSRYVIEPVEPIFNSISDKVDNIVHPILNTVSDGSKSVGHWVYEATHITFDDLEELISKHYKSHLSVHHGDFMKKFKWFLEHDKYEYDVTIRDNKVSLTATQRATDHLRMIYMAYQLGLLTEDEASFLFLGVKDNHMQALQRRLDKTTDRGSKIAMQSAIDQWNKLTVKMWKSREGKFGGNDFTGNWI